MKHINNSINKRNLKKGRIRKMTKKCVEQNENTNYNDDSEKEDNNDDDDDDSDKVMFSYIQSPICNKYPHHYVPT